MYHPLLQLSTLGSSKIEDSETYFFDIVTTQYDYPRYVKHVLGRIHVSFTLFGFWVREGGLEHNVLMQYFTLGSSKIEVFESYFFEPVIT